MELFPEYLICKRIAKKLVNVPPEIPENELNVGLFHEVMGSIPQINFFNAISQITPLQDTKDEYTGDLPMQGSVS